MSFSGILISLGVVLLFGMFSKVGGKKKPSARQPHRENFPFPNDQSDDLERTLRRLMGVPDPTPPPRDVEQQPSKPYRHFTETDFDEHDYAPAADEARVEEYSNDEGRMPIPAYATVGAGDDGGFAMPDDSITSSIVLDDQVETKRIKPATMVQDQSKAMMVMGERFDIKKAVIFAEILKPRYAEY